MTEQRKADQMSEAPERIWAHWGGQDCLVAFNAPSESYNTAYVRADLYDDQAKVIEAAKDWQTARAAFNEDDGDTKARFKAMAEAEANLTANLAALQENTND